MVEFINKIPSNFHNRLVLHDHYGLVSKYNVKGIHIRLGKSKQIYYRLLLHWLNKKYPNLTIATTIDRPSSLQSSSIRKFNYILVSNLFNLHTRSKFSPAYQSRDIQQMVLRQKNPLIAMGNVNLDTIGIAKSYSFSGFALQSNSWENKDWLSFFKALVRFDGEEESRFVNNSGAQPF